MFGSTPNFTQSSQASDGTDDRATCRYRSTGPGQRSQSTPSGRGSFVIRAVRAWIVCSRRVSEAYCSIRVRNNRVTHAASHSEAALSLFASVAYFATYHRALRDSRQDKPCAHNHALAGRVQNKRQNLKKRGWPTEVASGFQSQETRASQNGTFPTGNLSGLGSKAQFGPKAICAPRG
jgi:hypothetical protein